MSDQIFVTSTTMDKKVLFSCISIIAAFFPGINIQTGTPEQGREAFFLLQLEMQRGQFPGLQVYIRENHREVSEMINLQEDGRFDTLPLPGKEPLSQILIKRALFLFLTKITLEQNPWGILTGIRPGKLVSRMEEMELTAEIQSSILTDLYLVEKEKTLLLKTIAEIQKPYLQRIKRRPDLVSVYVTVPFCPSRCFYCSFPSNILNDRNKKYLPLYLQALFQEITLTGEMMKELDLKADCIYIGGGTPTLLESEDLQALFQIIQSSIPMENSVEYTVEGGRPDSIDRTKLLLMKASGVNRISINPQTMQEQTLIKIGRNHTVDEVVKCYGLAREMGDWIINMDLILGLPGEGHQEMMDSLEKVLALQPDNLTLHALAVKRGSAAWENRFTHNRKEDWANIMRSAGQCLKKSGLKPYYVYRQKNIAGNQENAGYTGNGKACRYNIGIIEEKQNIIGLGAGASSKIMKHTSGHVNSYNQLDLQYYAAHVFENHLKRKDTLRESYQRFDKF
ncbi:MAG: Oxygen-independent coproporphyrinogen-III oxidase-like protein HemZ [Candidatus Dichloromethanomonas elyunquensis]|nr:MAG: Oxygen-independent coproporphyrinogen-III oxidase-like protein HemZ [Candidatus Dichloromethanomonas elyunquensis]